MLALFLFALAFSVRVVFALQWRDTPYGDAPLLDAEVYHHWATLVAEGRGPAQVFYQSPLYPYLLGGLYFLVGSHFLAASLLNVTLDSLTVVLLSFVALEAFGEGAALFAGAVAAFCAPMVFYTAPPMKEALVLFLLSGFVLFSLWALRENRRWLFIFAGLCLGLGVLARGNSLLLAPLLPIMTVLKYRRAAVAPTMLFAFSFCSALVPVTVHNFRASHDFVPVTYADGFNLYIGHSSFANGTNAYPPEVATGPEQEQLDTTWIAQKTEGRDLRPSEVSAFWRDRAFQFIWEHPHREAVLLLRKFLAFFNGADSFDNYDLPFIARHFRTILNWPLVPFGFFAPLVAITLTATRRWNIEVGFLASGAALYILSVLIFYVTDRYRLPVLVFFIPLAGGIFPTIAHLWYGRDLRRLALTTATFGAFCALALAPQLDAVDLSAFDWGVLTAIYSEKSEGQSALDAFQQAIAISPLEAGSQAYVRAAGIYEGLGQRAKAEALVTKATVLFPQDGIALYNLGRMQALRGDLATALGTMKKAQALAPTYTLINFALGELYIKVGDRGHALESVWRGLAVDPQDSRLLELQAQISKP